MAFEHEGGAVLPTRHTLGGFHVKVTQRATAVQAFTIDSTNVAANVILVGFI